MRCSTRQQFCRIALLMAMVPALSPAQTPAPPPAAPAPAAAPAASAAKPASKEQLEQLLSPIALYPDSLLSQVLMAATYPADVADAAKWSKANKDQKGDAAVKMVQDQSWDPSVQSLVAFPQILQVMGDQPDWVQKLGDAFLASSKDVLDAVQRLRQKAQAAGNLKSNEQQKVIVEQEPTTQQTVIKVEPAQPETVYVPAYNPQVVYGTWPYPSYPPYYYPPPPYYYPGAALASGIAFGIGVAAIGSIWGGCNWGGGDVNINVNKYNSINSNRQINNNKFEHNSANRRGVPYGDQASRDKFDKGRGGAEGRNDYRGRDSSRDAQRQQAQSSLQNRGMDPAQGRSEMRNDPAARDRANQAAQGAGNRGGGGGFEGGGARAQDAARGNADSALRGAGNSGASRQQMDRGGSSRASAGSHGGGARASGGGGGRGGGGGGRGGGGRR